MKYNVIFVSKENRTCKGYTASQVRYKNFQHYQSKMIILKICFPLNGKPYIFIDCVILYEYYIRHNCKKGYALILIIIPSPMANHLNQILSKNSLAIA